MQKVFWVIPDLLAGRAGPSYATWSLAELYANGFRSVLNLSEFAPELDAFATVGLECTWMPISNTYPPADDVESDCLAILSSTAAFIAKQIAARRPVLVHCAWGRDRTGIVLAYYLALQQKLSA